MFKRQISTSINEWYNNSKNALLIDGARQIGKTTTIQEFLKKNKKINYIEINLIENKLALEAFNTSKDSEDLLLRISSFTKTEMVENKTIIFVDEIQEAKDAITPIKFLIQNSKYRFIFSGSLLGIKMNEILSIPTGYLQVMQMYPMNFEEFITALGTNSQTISYLEKCFKNKEIVDPIIHKQFLNLFHIYLVVGGMPKAVSEFVNTRNVYKVNQVLNDIDLAYRYDISKYEKNNKLLIQEIYDLIPSELNSQNKRFILKNLNEKGRFYKLETSFSWLKNSGIGLFVHNVKNPTYPLLANKERTLFKLFLSDVGLLTYKMYEGNQASILNEEVGNYGAIYEDVIAQELIAHNYNLFFHSNKKYGEIDFLIEENSKVIPIEIKSGKDYKRHSALNNLLNNDSFNLEKGYVFCNGNLELKNKIIYLPIYMIMFIKKEPQDKNQIIDINKF